MNLDMISDTEVEIFKTIDRYRQEVYLITASVSDTDKDYYNIGLELEKWCKLNLDDNFFIRLSSNVLVTKEVDFNDSESFRGDYALELVIRTKEDKTKFELYWM